MDDEMFEELCEGVEQAIAHAKGDEDLRDDQIRFVDEPDPRAIRAKLDLTQREFARLLDVSVDTVRNWEQGRRQPQGPAVTLLRVADQKPQALLDILGRTEGEIEEEATPTNKVCYLAKQRSHFKAVERGHEVMHARMETQSASTVAKFSFQKRQNKRSADDYSYAMAV